jgi:hypothetical protein
MVAARSKVAKQIIALINARTLGTCILGAGILGIRCMEAPNRRIVPRLIVLKKKSKFAPQPSHP